MKKNVFSKYYLRNAQDSNSEKAQNFANRMGSAPLILKVISWPIAAVLGKNHSLDHKLMKFPIVDLFTKFITGNAKLISMANSEVNAIETAYNISLLDLDKTYDVIVIGSGPGGSIAALREVEKGKSVLVLETGGAYAPGSIEHHSLKQTVNQFRNGGLSFIWGLKPVLYAEGSTLGGGSEVNSGLYHRLEGKHRSRILETINVSENEWSSLEELVE